MRKIAIAILGLALAGCATTPPYGNYLRASKVDQQQLAGEAVKQIAKLYPPGKVRLELEQPTPDAFGAALVKGLRRDGYALIEFGAEAPKVSAETVKAPVVRSGASASKALPLRYIVDQAGSPDLYRMTLMVGTESLTRPYLEQDGALVPAGYWVRKE
jgi:hypothetical protein